MLTALTVISNFGLQDLEGEVRTEADDWDDDMSHCKGIKDLGGERRFRHNEAGRRNTRKSRESAPDYRNVM